MNSFERDVISSINQFRLKPKSIDHDLELVRKGLSRLRPNDPFLTEIDTFIKQLQSLKPMSKCEYNETLSQIAKQEVKKFTRDEKYNKYRDSNDLRSIIPKEYQNQNCSLVADDGADEPETVVPKVLLNKIDKAKHGRTTLTNPKYTQVGIGHDVFDGENYIVIIFANEYVSDEPDVELPDGDLSELKKAFDILDIEKNGKIKINETLDLMKKMRFDVDNPDLYDIFDQMADRNIVTWPKFASIANERMTDRKTDDGLRTIFNLFIDNPDKNTITFDTFKYLAKEIGENLSDDELRRILKNCTKNGGEISFDDFVSYMKVK